jgi:DNA-binding PadR family transcriptional regulator
VSAQRPSEDQEWVSDRIESWVETYKKSMLTPVILDLVATHQPASVAQVADGVTATTGWQITERGLYRTLKRLRDSGLLTSADVDAPRTGAKRQELSLTSLGAEFLAGVASNLIRLPSTSRASAENQV